MQGDDDELRRLSARVDALEREVAQLRYGIASPAPAAAAAAAPAAAPQTAPPPPAAPAPRPAPVTPPKQRSDVESIVGGRGLLFVGALLVAAGVAFFLKIAFDHGWIGPPMRVALGILAGVALIAGPTLRRAKLHPYFADTLVGLGAAFVYLSLWAAGTLFGLLPAIAIALGTFVVTATLCILAYRDNRQPLAHVGIAGGLIAPLLLGTTSPDAVMLFSYLALLSAGAIALGELRGWRAVPIVALVGAVLYWVAFSAGDTNKYPIAERLAISIVLYAVFASTTVIAWARRTPLDGWRIAVASVNAAWFFIGLRALVPDHASVLAITFLAIGAAHLIGGARFGQRAQFWLATVALTFAIPSISWSFSKFLNAEGLTAMTNLAWILEATAMGLIAARTADRVLMWLSGAIFAAAVLGSLTALDETGSRLLLNQRFLTFFFAAIGTAIVRSKLGEAGLIARGGSIAGKIVIDLLALIAISPEAYRAGQLLQPHDADQSGIVALSIVWALYGGSQIVLGIRRHDATSRWEGLALLGITVIKVFAVDLQNVDVIFKVVSALGLGIVMLVLAYLYQTRLRASNTEAKP